MLYDLNFTRFSTTTFYFLVSPKTLNNFSFVINFFSLHKNNFKIVIGTFIRHQASSSIESFFQLNPFMQEL